MKKNEAPEKGNFEDNIQFVHLRQKAVNELKNRQVDRSNLNEEEARVLFYELQIHQIELQMQSEELRQAQLALEESHNRYMELYDNAPVGYFTIQENGLILDANLTGAGLLGIDRTALKDRPFSDFILKEDQDKFYLHRHKVYKNLEPELTELRMVTQTGDNFVAQLKSMLVGETTQSMRVIVTDITEQKHAEEALLFSQKIAELGTLTAGLAHEINSPLQIVIGVSERILRTIASNNIDLNQVKHDAELIQNTGWRMAEIIQMLHNSVRAYRSDMEVVDLNETIYTTVSSIQNQKKEWSKIKVNQHFDQYIPPIYCSRSGIIQVITNLLDNAHDAMPSGGEITLETSYQAKNEKFLIKIKDSGHGMTEEIQSMIFDPFFTTKEMGDGIGMGLSIVLGIINIHGGNITVNSKPGMGATFTITLPARPTVETMNKLPGRFSDF